MKKIFILIGHPNKEEVFCKSIALAYEKGAKEAGHEVRIMNVAEMQFDPILHKGYKVIQDLEPDLIKFQENIKWCEHFVIVYPTWWTTVPALLKGLFDRAWISGFAFKFKPYGLWNKLLIGRTAHVITTMGAYTFFEFIAFGNVTKILENNILRFAGFSPIFTTWIGNAEKMNSKTREKWLKKIEIHGRKSK